MLGCPGIKGELSLIKNMGPVFIFGYQTIENRRVYHQIEWGLLTSLVDENYIHTYKAKDARQHDKWMIGLMAAG